MLFRAARSDKRISTQHIQYPKSDLCIGVARQLVPPTRQERVDAFSAAYGVFGLTRHTVQKVLQPVQPIALFGNATETVVIVRAGGLKERGQVKKRRRQN